MDTLPSMKLPAHDALSRLAREDPQGFEDLRSRLIEGRINSAPERIRHRLRQLQFRVDGIRRMSRSPLGATLRIQALMWECFLEMNDKLQAFSRDSLESPCFSKTGTGVKKSAHKNALVIQFHPRLPVAGGA